MLYITHIQDKLRTKCPHIESYIIERMTNKDSHDVIGDLLKELMIKFLWLIICHFYFRIFKFCRLCCHLFGKNTKHFTDGHKDSIKVKICVVCRKVGSLPALAAGMCECDHVSNEHLTLTEANHSLKEILRLFNQGSGGNCLYSS